MKKQFILGFLLIWALVFLVGLLPGWCGEITPVTTVENFLIVADKAKVGPTPYYLSVFALILIPIFTQFLKTVGNFPKWLAYLTPTIISLVGASVTAVAYGFMPWDEQGIEIVLLTLIGGGTGQGAYMFNRKRAKDKYSAVGDTVNS